MSSPPGAGRCGLGALRCIRGGRRQEADGGSALALGAEAGDLVVLGGGPGECLFPEAVQVGDGGVAVGQPIPEDGVLVLEPSDLGVAAVGDVTYLLAGQG